MNKIKINIPIKVQKTLKFLTYAVVSSLLSFLAQWVLTGEIDIAEVEVVVRTYLFNMIMVIAVLFKKD